VNGYDLLSIDAEGAEMEILSSISFSKYSFEMIIIEKSSVNILERMSTNGYKLFH
jgi:hypothetical protein